MNVEQQEALLFLRGEYTLRHSNGQPAIDGLPGPSLTEAIKKAQRALDLPVTGEWDEKTELFALRSLSTNGVETECPPPVPELSWPGKYFSKSEFACKCGRCGGFPADPSPDLVRLLDNIREHFGRPVLITSGVRCKAHNAAVGGVSNSQHLYGTAADIVVQGITPANVATYVETVMPDSGGIGRYPSFTHVDVRKSRARWHG